MIKLKPTVFISTYSMDDAKKIAAVLDGAIKKAERLDTDEVNIVLETYNYGKISTKITYDEEA